MNELGSLLFLYTETPLHAGSGIALGAIDLPIQRERITQYPMVQGSGIKGCLREAFKPASKEGKDSSEERDLWLQWFGPELAGGSNGNSAADESDAQTGKPEREEFAGAIAVQDARILLLPVRSVWDGFAWVTCPLVLQRLARDIAIVGLPDPTWARTLTEDIKPLTSNPNAAPVALVAKECTVMEGKPERKRVLLEDIDYDARPTTDFVSNVAAWLKEHVIPKHKEYEPFAASLVQRLVIVDNAQFAHWAKFGTEVVARIAIDPNTGTVKQGALWSEESLPAETVLWAPTFFTKCRRPNPQAPAKPWQQVEADELRNAFRDKLNAIRRIRLGGDRAVGRGIVATTLLEGGRR